MTAPVAWWPELRAEFALSVTPAMQMSSISRISATATLGVTPSVGMEAAVCAVASFGLTLTPQFAMAVPLATPASFGVGVTPQVGVSGAEHYARTLTFGVTPAVGVAGTLRRAGSFGLSVTPAVGMTAASPMTGVGYTQTSVYAGLTAATYANMNDNNASGAGNATATNPSGGGEQYIMADAGSSKFISHIVVGYDYLNNLPTGWGPTFTDGLDVEGSNDTVSWTHIATVPTYTGTPANGLRSITVNATWRYIRLLRTVAANNYMAATEFSLWP